MANNTLIASDNFASGALAAGWSTLTGYSAKPAITGSAPYYAEPTTTSTNCGVIWTGSSTPNNQVCEVTVENLANESGSIIQLYVRWQQGSSQSGYTAQILGSGTGSLRKVVAGSGTAETTFTGLTIAAGDVFTLYAFGSFIALYHNGIRVSYYADSSSTAYTTGSYGFSVYSTVNVTHAQVASWRGYSNTQQDGIWSKQSIIFPATYADSSAGAQNCWILPNLTGQILTGKVYGMWFGSNVSIGYAESYDCINWTRYSSNPVLAIANADAPTPCVIFDGSQFHLYAVANNALVHYTSSNGLSWSASTAIITGATLQYAPYFFYVFPANGEWYAVFNQQSATASQTTSYLAKSSDLSNWVVQNSGNPITTNFWAFLPMLIGGTWYGWGQSCLLGTGSSNTYIDPYETIRMQSTDLIHWTKKVNSTHHSLAEESLNTNTGGGGATFAIEVSGKLYLIFGSQSPADPDWFQIGLAIAPASAAQIVTQNEDAVQEIASDAFTSGAGNLDGNWTTPTGGTALKIVAGPYVEPTVTSTICQAVYTGATFSESQYSEVTIEALTGTLAQSVIYPMVLASTTALTDYEGWVASPTATSDAAAAIYKRVAGSATQIGPTAGVTPAVGDVWRLSVFIGSDGFPVLSLFQNGYLVLQVQDSSSTPITTGNPGIAAYSSLAIGDAQISLWAGGNANVIPNYPGAGGFLPPFGAGPTGTLGEGASPSASSNRTSVFGTGRTEIIG